MRSRSSATRRRASSSRECSRSRARSTSWARALCRLRRTSPKSTAAADQPTNTSAPTQLSPDAARLAVPSTIQAATPPMTAVRRSVRHDSAANASQPVT